MDSELAIVGQIWQYNKCDLYFVASFDGTDNIPLTGATRYWYTLLPINKPDDVPPIIKYDSWRKITEMPLFKRVS
jgi:hypothetical protein